MKNANENCQPGIDKQFLRGIVDNDKEFEKELFTIFSENVHRNLAKMSESIIENNNNSWYMAAHAFKGAAASIGAFNLARILEYAQKHPEENAQQKEKLLSEVRSEIAVVLEFINEELM